MAGEPVAPPIVHDVLRSPGRPIESGLRSSLEVGFGRSLEYVRVHDGARAAESADRVGARAYTVGRDVVFAADEYRPDTGAGRELLAHELAHVLQSEKEPVGGSDVVVANDPALEAQADAAAASVASRSAPHGFELAPSAGLRTLRRTPARKVSCGAGPLHVPDATPFDVADPVQVITDAESLANQWLDEAIATLAFTRDAIVAGAPVGWPTIGDSLGQAMKLLALNPDSENVWKRTGIGTAELLLRRLRAIRRTIGAGSFFFVCLGPANGAIGSCAGTICGGGANAASCDGAFQIDFCVPFWSETPEHQAETLLHESTHNFAAFIQDTGREGNAGCYSRFVQVAIGVDESAQRADLCPDPAP